MTSFSQASSGADRRSPGPDAETELARLIVQLLAEEAPALHLWEQIAARLRLPRLPRHLAKADQVSIVRHWMCRLDVKEPELFGLERGLWYRVAQLASSQQDWPAEIPRMTSEVLTPSLARAVIQAALLYAPVAPQVARTLVELADALGHELECRQQPRRALRALRAEVNVGKAVVGALQGDIDAAKPWLLRAGKTLKTCQRLKDWTTATGELVPPPSPHLPLSSHALWLHGCGFVEVAAGHLESAARCFDLAFRLYLADRAFFGAGMVAVLKASTCCWLGRPDAAMFPLEISLQLLDLRGLFRLGDTLQVELLVLYASQGRTREAQRELDLLPAGEALVGAVRLRAEAWVAWSEGNWSDAQQLLLQARQQASDAGTRRLISTELALWEWRQRRVDSALTWLRAEVGHLSDLSPALQVLWRAVMVDPSRLPRLMAALQRAQALPGVEWHPPRVGSALPELGLPELGLTDKASVEESTSCPESEHGQA